MFIYILFRRPIVTDVKAKRKNRQVVARTTWTVSLFWNFSFHNAIDSALSLACFFSFLLFFPLEPTADEQTSETSWKHTFPSARLGAPLEVIEWFNEIHVLLFHSILLSFVSVMLWIDENRLIVRSYSETYCWAVYINLYPRPPEKRVQLKFLIRLLSFLLSLPFRLRIPVRCFIGIWEMKLSLDRAQE